MNDQKFQHFIDLVTFDQIINDLEKKIEISELAYKKMRGQVLALDKQMEQYGSKRDEIKKQLDVQELRVKDLQEQESRQSAVTQLVSTVKECDAANKELEVLKLERHMHEQKMLQLINKLDAAQKEYQALSEKDEKEKADLHKLMLEQQEISNATDSELQSLSNDRMLKVEGVPGEWLELYENMRGRVKNPVVNIAADSCSACFYLISSRDLQKIRNNEMCQCKDCYRFLYYEAAKS